jgi:hypothetical protein
MQTERGCLIHSLCLYFLSSGQYQNNLVATLCRNIWICGLLHQIAQTLLNVVVMHVFVFEKCLIDKFQPVLGSEACLNYAEGSTTLDVGLIDVSQCECDHRQSTRSQSVILLVKYVLKVLLSDEEPTTCKCGPGRIMEPVNHALRM